MAAEVIENYRAWLEDSICPTLRAWAPGAAVLRFEEARRQFIERTSSDTSSIGYAEACPVPGVQHSAYRLRKITLPGGITLIAGIHFKGMRPGLYPFVGVFAQERWLSAEQTVQAHSVLMDQFAEFSPRASWWWTRPGRDLEGIGGVELEQHLVVGSLHEIRQSAAPGLPSNWQSRRAESAEGFGTKLQEFYREFHEQRTDLSDHVPAADADDLQACVVEGGLFGCFVGTELAGIVAAKPGGEEYGVQAWIMWEFILARRYCGKGLAPLLQRAALDQLDAERAPLVLGTIHAKNQPSLRTALRVGRRVVGSWVFLTR
jgi:RimJ/RimL family protein N-acetyltransferase